MYDTRFTSEPITEEDGRRGFRTVTTPEGKILCRVSDAEICDLNGERIASFTHKEKREDEEETVTVSIYESEKYGEFAVKENELYLGDEFLGIMPAKKNFARHILFLLFGFILVVTAVTAALVAVLMRPKEEFPVINVRDDNGEWKAQGTVAVLDDDIYPDASGTYNFIIRNSYKEKLLYSFSIVEYYNGEVATVSPLEYRVRVSNVPVGTGEFVPSEELHFEEVTFMPESDHLVTIEWRWPFESGNDESDTEFGKDGGHISLQLELTAETIE